MRVSCSFIHYRYDLPRCTTDEHCRGSCTVGSQHVTHIWTRWFTLAVPRGALGCRLVDKSRSPSRLRRTFSMTCRHSVHTETTAALPVRHVASLQQNCRTSISDPESTDIPEAAAAAKLEAECDGLDAELYEFKLPKTRYKPAQSPVCRCVVPTLSRASATDGPTPSVWRGPGVLKRAAVPRVHDRCSASALPEEPAACARPMSHPLVLGPQHAPQNVQP